MRPELFKHLKSAKKYDQGEGPVIQRQLRPLPEPVACNHAVLVSGDDIVKGIQLKNRFHPGHTVCKHRFMIHNGAEPDAKLQADSHDLSHILEKYIDRSCKISQSQRQHRGCKGIIENLDPGNAHRHPGDQP